MRRADRRAIELVHAFGVDELRTDLQPNQERRGHAFAAFVEVLDQVRVSPYRDDQIGATLPREQ